MRLAFERDEPRGRIRGRFRLGAEYQGGPGFIHGGIVATVLDEAMGKVSRFSDVRTVTAELKIEFHRPVPVDAEIIVEAFQVERNGRNLIHQGEVRDLTGRLLARGEGRFVAMDLETYQARVQDRKATK